MTPQTPGRDDEDSRSGPDIKDTREDPDVLEDIGSWPWSPNSGVTAELDKAVLMQRSLLVGYVGS